MNRLRKLVAAAVLATLATTASAVDGLVIFGDSLSDAGNAALFVGANPLQVVGGNTYIPSQPYASNQFTNGDVWAKTFASAIGLGPFAQPWLSGGARTSPSAAPAPRPTASACRRACGLSKASSSAMRPATSRRRRSST